MFLQPKELAGAILSRTWLVLVLIIVNLAGAAYGYYWYAGHLTAAPWRLWPFIPDGPLVVSLFVLVLILRLSGRPTSWLEAITFLGLIKYGAWTVLVTGYHLFTGGAATLENYLLIIFHLGMVGQGAVFLPILRPARRLWLIVIGWFVLNDFLDYGVGTHPYLPNPAQVTEAIAFAAAGTVFAGLYVLRLRRVTRSHFNFRYPIR
ncbi:MAG: DUF1405 domain-containing protein [Bacillota bacterium]